MIARIFTNTFRRGSSFRYDVIGFLRMSRSVTKGRQGVEKSVKQCDDICEQP